MRVLVTGGAGFIGRRVVHRLVCDGHEVEIVDSLDDRVHDRFASEEFEGFECPYFETPQNVLESVDAVVHLAAQVSVADSTVDPLRYMLQNSADTAHFLTRLRGCDNIKKLVVASSMSVYGCPNDLPVKEYAPCLPQSVYGLSKFDQERLSLLLFPRDVVALRFFNVYGPGQALNNPYTGVLANFANWLLRGEQPLVYEDGQQTRDFIYVDDVVEAIISGLRSKASGVYNVCTGTAVTIETAARTLATALGVEIEPNITGFERPGDVRHVVGDASAAKLSLGWSARTTFSEGIERYATALREVALV